MASMRVPFFHYTSLDNLPRILIDSRLKSRSELNRNLTLFNDVSIDSRQLTRGKLGLMKFIPLFAGFYTIYNNEELSDCLNKKHSYTLVQNKTFYGSLNQTLQFNLGKDYEKIIILMVNNELVYKFADQGKARFFSDIAIREESEETTISNRLDLENCLKENIDGPFISGEIDVLDDGKVSIGCMSDIEAIIVDNERIKARVLEVIAKHGRTSPLVLVQALPRNPKSRKVLLQQVSRNQTSCYYTGPTEEQKAFANYVENLKQNELTGEKYREKIAEWQREHRKS
jgi:hypothetical protein